MRPVVQTILNDMTPIILGHFGDKAQMIKACEELAELTAKLCKRLNNCPHFNDSEIVDEVADVLIMATQLRTIFGHKEVDDRILFKIDRTMQYINKRNRLAMGLEK